MFRRHKHTWEPFSHGITCGEWADFAYISAACECGKTKDFVPKVSVT